MSPVTGIFAHQSKNVWALQFDNGEQLGATYNHPFYSATHQEWRTAGQLEIGEEVLTLHGKLTLAAKEKLGDGPTLVYNLEVKGFHNYLVGSEGIVVHNVCWNEVNAWLAKGTDDLKLYVKDLWDNNKYPDFFKRGSFFEFLMREKKFKDWNFTGKPNPPNSTGDDISNFWLVDFYIDIPGGRKVASMKTTTVDDVSKWLTGDNKKHVEKLSERKALETFPPFAPPFEPLPTDTRVIRDVKEVELHIFLPKDKWDYADPAVWQAAIDQVAGQGNVKVLLDYVERNL
ncbi:MAG: hypothetical protein IPN76_16245 [Saprospiraceae bacterium]|nr:hypothetical protein [Saprospiraceae bacterium]